jgi:hypothetical protein
MPRLWRLIAGPSLRRAGFDSGPVHVGFLVNKGTLEQVFLRVLRFSPVSIILPTPHFHSSITDALYLSD